MAESTIINNFTVGKVSPRAEGRIDLEAYHRSCRILDNFIIAPQGGADRRPGTKWVVNSKTSGDDASAVITLIPFIDKGGQYVLEFGHNYMRVIDAGDHAQEMSGSAEYELETAYDYTYLSRLQYITRYNPDSAVEDYGMVIVEPYYKVKELTNSADNSWSLDDVTFDSGGVLFNAEADEALGSHPGTITLFEQRLVLSGTYDNPNRIHLSAPGDPYNFATGALAFDLSSELPVHIYWVASKKREIAIGCDNGNGILSGEGLPISSANYQIGTECSFGSKQYIKGVTADGNYVYAQAGGRKLRTLVYNDNTKAWDSYDLTHFASDILGTGVAQVCVQNTPDTVIWCRTEAGALVGLTFDAKLGVTGWHEHDVSGLVESMCIMPKSTEDELWLAVKRTINSTVYRSIEYMTPRDYGDDQEDAYFVDCGITVDHGAAVNVTGLTKADPVVLTVDDASGLASGDFVRLSECGGMTEVNGNVYLLSAASGSASFTLNLTDDSDELNGSGFTTYTSGGTCTQVQQIITGAGHLEGQTVAVLADGAAHPDATVTSGTFTLQVWANTIHYGLPYTSTLQPQRLNPQGQVKRIHKLLIRLYKTLGCKMGPTIDALDTVIFREASDPMDAPPPLFTGDHEIDFDGNYEYEGDIVVVQDQPLPLNIVALIAKFRSYPE